MGMRMQGAVLGAVLLAGCGDGANGSDFADFAEAVAACEPAEFNTRQAVDALARYEVAGPAEGGCRVGFTYVRNPNAQLQGKALSFVVNPQEDVAAQVRAGLRECLEGRSGSHRCQGELFEAVGGISAPLARAPMSCGEPVAVSGEPLYPLPRGGKWGYVSAHGDWVIEPRWERAGRFSEGRANVAENGAWGVIDRRGDYVVEPQFRAQSYATVDGVRIGSSPMKPFSEGCAAVVGNTASQPPFLVDRQGAIHWRDELPAALDDLDVREFGGFSEGRTWFRTFTMELEGGFGWVDAGGAVVIPPEFSGAGDFVGGLAPAGRKRQQWGFIDTEGELALPGKWTLGHAQPFSDGRAYVDIGVYRPAYMDRQGNRFEQVTFDDGQGAAAIDAGGDFSDGLAAVLADVNGTSTLAYVKPDGTVALVPEDAAGIEVCNERDLPAFHDGLVRLLVADDGTDCGADVNGLGLAAYQQAHYAYFDQEGEVVLEQARSPGHGDG